MNDSRQLYEEIVRLKSAPRKGVDNLSRPFVAPQQAHSTCDSLSRVGHIEHAFVIGMAQQAPVP